MCTVARKQVHGEKPEQALLSALPWPAWQENKTSLTARTVGVWQERH